MTGLSLLASFILMGQDERPRIKEDLANGVKVLVSEEPTPDRAVVVVFASASGVSDTPETQGQRHLLEHIIAKGPNKDADRRLETVGALLNAQTTRAGMYLTIEGPNDQLPLMLDVMKDVVSGVKTTQEELDRELGILRQEKVGLPRWWGFDAEAWKVGFGEAAVDPFGDLEALKGVTPEVLQEVFERTFSGATVAVTVTGDIDAGPTMLRCREAFAVLGRGDAVGNGKRKVEEVSGSKRVTARGQSRSVVVPGMANAKTAATVGVARILAGRVGGQVLYDPDLDPGLVTIWTPQSGAMAAIDEMAPAEVAGMRTQARLAAHSWFRSLAGTDVGHARLEAMLLQARSVTTIEIMESFCLGADDNELMAAYQLFRSGSAIEVNGR